MVRAGTPNESAIAKQKLDDMDRPAGRKTSPRRALSDAEYRELDDLMEDEIRRYGFGPPIFTSWGPMFSSTHYADDEPIETVTKDWYRAWVFKRE